MPTFADLHRPGDPLLLPNAWDHASAAALAAAGFPAIGTTSLGVAAAVGKPDAAGSTRRETLGLARRIVHLDAFVTVDLEHGFSEDPTAVADLAAELAALGVAGVNLEDGRGAALAAPADHAALVAAVKTRAPGLFVNARTDTHWLGVDAGTTLERARTLRRGRGGRRVRAGRHRRGGDRAPRGRARRPAQRALRSHPPAPGGASRR